MINVGANFGRKVPCPLGCDDKDDQEHLTQCKIIKMYCFDVMVNSLNPKGLTMEDIHSEDLETLTRTVQLMETAFRTRQVLLEEL